MPTLMLAARLRARSALLSALGMVAVMGDGRRGEVVTTPITATRNVPAMSYLDGWGTTQVILGLRPA